MTNEIVTAIPRVFNHVIAFEVSKRDIHVHSRPGGTLVKISNSAAEIRKQIKKELVRNAKLGLGPLLVICEATGSYDRLVTGCAAELGVACHRAHGSQVRAFAKFRGMKAKTDAIDAPLLSDFAVTSQNLRQHEPPSPEQVDLREFVERRTELREMKEAEEARLEHVRNKSVADDIRRHIRHLETRIAAFDESIEALIKAIDRFAEKAALMRTVKSVGPQTVAAVLAYLPEIGTVGRGTIAALAGLAPYDEQSGVHDGPRHIAGGRAGVRKTLYMTARVAVRCNEHLARYAARMKARGCADKVAITGVMRKLLVILNAVVASGKPCSQPGAGRVACV